MFDYKFLGSRIRAMRLERKITQEKLVAVTKTNAAGKYLFGDVIGGNYVVKAKLEQ